ncbi:PREDICTED: uncharacterized protein LOC108562481 [Nicrophorus vespilloides]|uniref:Uncharacterized protein LOC108562481 n=1 Tax=Nicrophorus vespilloides TaxID=110193 RepID=A0ABM1MP31_NICVS|nr:PREDICTED: uncharacterized protein LOC108562481 [Nicrophorus vespilloides]XP_017776332.1 PREDICTED: uncharacterized protein LOC108562481 [Nicrophorus vespilloides]XP_017776333.1 PREDICTED: uncharacterized protein LOC108562481 [Nicrophorus vespilloides]XP_017776334.1 PREDICTED: uncharacterized protein LOC108562481 [Nicrophorus vespilloides]
MSQVLKLLFSSNLKTLLSNRQNSVRTLSSITKELIRQSGPATYTNQDILLSNLKVASKTQNVLEIVNDHSKIMNHKHMMQALRSLFLLQKSGNSNLSIQQIIKHPDFEKLCKCLKKHSGAIELNDSIEALKVMNFIGVQSDSTIVQVLLQLIRHQINDLSLHQIIFIDFLFTHMKSTPLVEALRLALPIVFEIQIPYKLDRENLLTMTECLQYVSKKNVSDKCVETIVNSIVKYRGDIDFRNAMSIVWSICDMEADPYFEQLMKRCLDCLIVQFDSLQLTDIETTLSKLVHRVSNKHTFYYNDVFIDLSVNRILDNDLGFEPAIHILRRLFKVYHEHSNLMDYILKKIHDDPLTFENTSSVNISIIVFMLGMCNGNSKYMDSIKGTLQTSNKLKNLKDMFWLKMATSLCILDVYVPEILEKALSDANINKTINKGFVADYRNLLLLKQSITLYKSDYMSMLPANEVLEQLQSKVSADNEFPLEASLQVAFGGQNYVKTNIVSELYHTIDHVVMLRKGGYAVAFPPANNSNKLEDLDMGDNQMVLIYGLNNMHYMRNTKTMKGFVSHSIKTLESMGHTVVSICLDDWNALSDFERIPFLMQAIKEKTEHLAIMSDSI